MSLGVRALPKNERAVYRDRTIDKCSFLQTTALSGITEVRRTAGASRSLSSHHRIFVIAALASPLIALSSVGPGWAEPDKCVNSGSAVYTCSGNQSGGIVIGSNSDVPFSADSIVVNNLTPHSDNAPYTNSFIRVAEEKADDTLVFEMMMGTIPLNTELSTGAVQLETRPPDDGASGRPVVLDFQGAARGSEPNVFF